MTRTTGEIEREAEATRAKLSSTLDEIQRRMEPGQLMDQAFSYARNNGGADFVRNAGAQARDNPLPVLLIGAGLAWLMSGRRPGSGPSAGAIHDAANRRAHDARDVASGVAGAVSSAMSSVADGVKGAASSAGSGVGHAGGAAGHMGASAQGKAGDVLGQLQSLFAQNPVAMGALGVALGAAIGAALPATETENRLIGESADDMKSVARTAAEEQMERGKQAASAGLGEARATMAPHADGASRPDPAASSPLGGPSIT